jgi:hypothetical protein
MAANGYSNWNLLYEDYYKFIKKKSIVFEWYFGPQDSWLPREYFSRLEQYKRKIMLMHKFSAVNDSKWRIFKYEIKIKNCWDIWQQGADWKNW